MKSFIAAAALVAAATASKLSARDETWNYNSTCNGKTQIAKVVNRCSYPIYLWSIDKQMGCPSGTGLEVKPGQFYHEDLRNSTSADGGGVSVKISKFESCGGKDITQLEYKMSYQPGYEGNYLDMSFVDCVGNLEDCPGRTDGFYLQAGNQNGLFKSAVDNEHCPIFNVYNAEEAAKVSYINWNDPQTKWCNTQANVELYLCGGEAPSADDEDGFSAAPASSTEIKSSSSAKPTSSSAQPSSSSADEAPAPSTTEDAYVVAAAAVTSAPAAAPVIKTEVVYVTEYVNKRHAHARRHQHFHA